MIIQHNMQAANANRMLGTVVTSQAKSTEKLSSGYRINRAADDAAGLSISEKMRGQIRGLNQASTNAQDGISLIQTAEGALTETHSILQRMRELAVQAATDTNVDKDREAIQSEIDELTSEINRISKTTQYNKMELLDGSRSENYTTSPAETKEATVIKAGTINVQSSTGITQSGNTDSTDALHNVTINIDNTADVWKETLDITGSNQVKLTKDADGKIKVEIDAKGGTAAATGITTLDIEDIIEAEADGSFKYNKHGVSFEITKEDYAAWKEGADVTLDVKTAAGLTANGTLNSKLAVGVDNDYSADNKGITIDKIEFSEDMPEEYKNFKVNVNFTDGANGAADNLVLTLTVGETGKEKIIDKITLNKNDIASGTAANADAYTYDNHGIKFTIKADKTDGTANKATTNYDLEYDLTDKLETEKKTVTTKAAETEDKSLYFQVGANKNQYINVSIDDMGADALGLTSATAGGDFTTTQTVTNGTDKNKTKYSLNMTTRETANNAIETIDNAIEMVSKQRSKLGAIQNRLEHTIANLDNTSENLQSAESNIRDVDMAEEMVVYSKNNILQQAAQSMLAQANQSTQGVLSLLQ